MTHGSGCGVVAQVGVALLAMHQWLASLRAAAASPEGSPALEANRKLAVINGMGDHSRAQGNSSAVKEAIGVLRPLNPSARDKCHLQCQACVRSTLKPVHFSSLSQSCLRSSSPLQSKLSCADERGDERHLVNVPPQGSVHRARPVCVRLDQADGGWVCRSIADRGRGALPAGGGPPEVRAPGGRHAAPHRVAAVGQLGRLLRPVLRRPLRGWPGAYLTCLGLELQTTPIVPSCTFMHACCCLIVLSASLAALGRSRKLPRFARASLWDVSSPEFSHR